MSPDIFRTIRRNAGLTQARLAALIGLHSSQAVRRYEAAPDVSMHRPVPPALARLMRLVQLGYLQAVREADQAERADDPADSE